MKIKPHKIATWVIVKLTRCNLKPDRVNLVAPARPAFKAYSQQYWPLPYVCQCSWCTGRSSKIKDRNFGSAQIQMMHELSVLQHYQNTYMTLTDTYEKSKFIDLVHNTNSKHFSSAQYLFIQKRYWAEEILSRRDMIENREDWNLKLGMQALTQKKDDNLPIFLTRTKH